MAALASTSANVAALKVSASVLLATAVVAMTAVNKIQPSQLAEEQRNATRLWRELERDLSAMGAGRRCCRGLASNLNTRNVVGRKSSLGLKWRREQTWGGIGCRPRRWMETSKATLTES
ncbi:hypothetical protein ACQ4PT_011384 [Festuca glaucescens]